VRSKKGLVFVAGLVMVTLIILTKAYLVLREKNANMPIYKIGEQQFSIFRSYEDYDKLVEEYDYNARQAAVISIINLAYDGGTDRARDSETYDSNDCGNYGGFELWQSSSASFDECFPENSYRSAYSNKYYQNYVGNKGGYIETLIIDKGGYSIIYGTSSTQKQIVKGVRTETRIESVQTGLVSPPIVSYDDAEALAGPHCTDEERKDGKCNYVPRDKFYNLYSIAVPSDVHIVLAKPKGNAVTQEFGNLLLSIAAKWNTLECGVTDCQAAIYVSSLSTGKTHSKDSKHNSGEGADISACIDKNGVRHTSSAFDSDFKRCYELVKRELAGKGTFIGHDDCILESGQKCASAATLIPQHQNHIHIQIKSIK
jgi:hypothetical protein